MSDPRNVSGVQSDATNEPEVFIGEATTVPGTARGSRQGSGVIPASLLVGVVILALLVGGLMGHFIPQGSQDVSPAGRMAYACTLIGDVRETHPTSDDWGDFDDPGYADVVAAAGLLGGFMPAVDDDDRAWELGNRLFGALAVFDPEKLSDAVDATHAACEER